MTAQRDPTRFMIACNQFYGWVQNNHGNGIEGSREEIIIDAWNDKIEWLITVGIDDHNFPVLGMFDTPDTQWFNFLPWRYVLYGPGQVSLICEPVNIAGFEKPVQIQPFTILMSEQHILHMKKLEKLKLVRFFAAHNKDAEITQELPVILERITT